MARSLKKRSHAEIQAINNFIPLAMARSKQDMITSLTVVSEAERFSFHMDQLTINANLRFGHVNRTYEADYGF